MRILYVYTHPNEQSFNKTLRDYALSIIRDANHELIISDLYAQQFNAVASWQDFILNTESVNPQYMLAQQEALRQNAICDEITAEMEKIAWADHILFQFPLWWFSTPAILKGWFDRVLVKGFAYDTGKIFENGLLQNKTASLVVTTHSPASAYQHAGVHHATIETFLQHIHHTLRFVGVTVTTPFVAHGVANLDDIQQQNIMANLRDYLQNLRPASW